MITEKEVIPLFLEACPSFSPVWQAYLESYDNEGPGLYIDLGELAIHIVNLYKTNHIKEFPKIFEIIERMHVEGNNYVKEAATIGLLEGIQNVVSGEDIDINIFVPYLGPVSKEYWDKIIKFWETGEIIKGN